MKKKGAKALGIILGILIVVALIIVGAVIFSHHPSSTGNVVSNPGSSGVLFADSPYANFAYLLSSSSLSPEAQQALTGFNVEKHANSDGSITYDLVAINPEYQNQSYTLKPGQSLYFIESSFGDDATGSENFLADDSAIVVDSGGYIVQGPGTA